MLSAQAPSGAACGTWAGVEEPGIASCARGRRRLRLRAGPWPHLRDSCKCMYRFTDLRALGTLFPDAVRAGARRRERRRRLRAWAAARPAS